MPFEELETISRHNEPPTAVLTYMRPEPRAAKPGAKPKKYDRDSVKPRLVITIPTTICGTGKADSHRLLCGTGNDLGKLRIKGAAKNDKSAISPSEHKHFFRWIFGYVPKFGDEIFDGQRCPVKKISDDEFEIVVPSSWFK